MNIYEKEGQVRSHANHLLGHHHVVVKDRKLMDVTGVKKLHSFDAEMFIIETTMGVLSVRGLDLEMKNLDLDKGDLSIMGHVSSYEYDDDGFDGFSGKGLFGKLFR